MFGQLLSQLTALSKLYQFWHWGSKGQFGYADHLLAERLYKEADELIDGVAEKAIGLFGNDEIDMVEDAKETTRLLTGWKELRAEHTMASVALKAVRDVVEFIVSLKHDLERNGDLSDGLDNMLQGIADKLESHIYLLQQRTSNTKSQGEQKMASISKRAATQGEYEVIDDMISSVLSMDKEFKTAVKGNNLKVADLMSEIMEKRIEDVIAELRKLVKEDLSGASVDLPESAMEEVALKLQLLKGKLKEVRTFMASRKMNKDEPAKETKKPMMVIKKKQVEAEVLSDLIKLATSLDDRGLYSEADKIDEMVRMLAERVGLISEAAKKPWKGNGEKPPKGAAKKAPKKWFDKMVKEVMSKNPKYTKEQAATTVGDLWDNKLTPAKRKDIFKQYGKKGDPDVATKKASISKRADGPEWMQTLTTPQKPEVKYEGPMPREMMDPSWQPMSIPQKPQTPVVKPEAPKAKKGLTDQQVRAFKEAYVAAKRAEGFTDVSMWPVDKKWSGFNQIYHSIEPGKSFEHKLQALKSKAAKTDKQEKLPPEMPPSAEEVKRQMVEQSEAAAKNLLTKVMAHSNNPKQQTKRMLSAIWSKLSVNEVSELMKLVDQLTHKYVKSAQSYKNVTEDKLVAFVLDNFSKDADFVKRVEFLMNKHR
jgi:DNA-binding ferritin-like protein